MSKKMEKCGHKKPYMLFFDLINMKNFDPNKIKIDEKSIYYIGYVTIKDS